MGDTINTLSRMVETFLEKHNILLTDVIMLMVIVLASWGLGKALVAYAKKHWVHKTTGEVQKFVTKMLVIIPPLSILLCLSLTQVILTNVFQKDTYTFFQVQNVVILWVLGQVALLFIQKKIAWRLILFLLLPLGIVLMRNLEDKVATVLNDWSLTIGTTNLSLYVILKSFLIVLALYWGARQLAFFAEKRIHKMRFVRPEMRTLALKFFQIVLYTFCFLWALNLLGIPLTSLTVFSGALGIGIGFGIQRIASNFISGVILLMEGSIKEEDIIELADGTFCTVRKTNARYTLAETFDGKEILIPNEELIVNRVLSWTHSHKRARGTLTIEVSYDSDLHLAQRLILETAQQHPNCVQTSDQEPLCFLKAFTSSSVQFVLLFWIDRIDYGFRTIKNDILFTLWEKFREHGIQLPYPQQDVHIRTFPPDFPPDFPSRQPSSRKKSP